MTQAEMFPQTEPEVDYSIYGNWLRSTCLFSEEEPEPLYRYTLRRDWNDAIGAGVCMFLMLNPSTADVAKNDPTVGRCEQFARDWGYGSLIVANLFAYRATDPRDMKAVADPVGPLNDYWISECARQADVIVCAWGNDGLYRNRSDRVRNMLKARYRLHFLRMTQKKEPWHPLYLPGRLVPLPYRF